MNKFPVALVCLVLPASLCTAADKPDGFLGVDMVSVTADYSHVDLSHYDQSGADFRGFGIGFNQHMAEWDKLGLDITFSHSYMEDAGGLSYSETSNMSMAGVTIYREGMICPFFRPYIGYVTAKNLDTDETFDTLTYGAVAGFEIRLLSGFAVTPYVQYDVYEDDEGNDVTIWGITSNYWFTEKLAVIADVDYYTMDNVDSVSASLGMAFHY
jgi:hypothetical protein